MNRKNKPIYLVSQGKKNAVPPLDEPPPFGLLYVGAALRKAGFPVRIFHLHGEHDRKLMQAVRSEGPLFVGFSNFVCPTLKLDIELSKQLKELGVPVVWGGIFTSCLPEVTLRSGVVDYIVVGEGERPAVSLAEAILNGDTPKDVPGVGYMQGEAPVICAPKPLEPEIDKYDIALDLVDWGPYIHENKNAGTRIIQLPFSRGCPMSCTFCYNSMDPERKKWRVHSLEFMQDMISYLKDSHGVNTVFLLCDNPFGRPEHAKRIIEGLRMPWLSIAHANIVNEDFIDWAKQSRCLRLGFGLESGSDRMLGILNKRITSEEIRQKLLLCGEKGLRTSSSWMVLVPGETLEDRRATVGLMDDIHSMNPTHGFKFSIFRAYPRTPLWKDAIDMGLHPPENLEEWGQFNPFSYPLFGLDSTWANRMNILMSSLFPFEREHDNRVPAALRPLLVKRLKNFSFNLPIEESVRFSYNMLRRVMP